MRIRDQIDIIPMFPTFNQTLEISVTSQRRHHCQGVKLPDLERGFSPQGWGLAPDLHNGKGGS